MKHPYYLLWPAFVVAVLVLGAVALAASPRPRRAHSKPFRLRYPTCESSVLHARGDTVWMVTRCVGSAK